MRQFLFNSTSGCGSTLLRLDEKGAIVVDSFTLRATRFCQVYCFLLEVSKIGYQIRQQKKNSIALTLTPPHHKDDNPYYYFLLSHSVKQPLPHLTLRWRQWSQAWVTQLRLLAPEDPSAVEEVEVEVGAWSAWRFEVCFLSGGADQSCRITE